MRILLIIVMMLCGAPVHAHPDLQLTDERGTWDGHVMEASWQGGSIRGHRPRRFKVWFIPHAVGQMTHEQASELERAHRGWKLPRVGGYDGADIRWICTTSSRAKKLPHCLTEVWLAEVDEWNRLVTLKNENKVLDPKKNQEAARNRHAQAFVVLILRIDD